MAHRIRTLTFGLACLLAVAAVAVLAGCDDDLLTSADAQLTPGADTLQLGDVLAGCSTATHQLILYNHSGGTIHPDRIALASGGQTGFRINVDGMRGTDFGRSDLRRIADGDSLHIFVEATFPASPSDTIYPLTADHIDYIHVDVGGQRTSVVLHATSRRVADVWRGRIIAADTTIAAGTELQVYDSLIIAEGATLTLAEGVTLYLHDHADIAVRGRLDMAGTEEHPVTLRGDRLDRMFPTLPYDHLPSQWGGIAIAATSHADTWTHADIRGMTTGITIDGDTSRLSPPALTIDRCRIASSGGALIAATRADLTIAGSELTQAAGALLHATGGTTLVVHSTLANYHFASRIAEPAVVLVADSTATAADSAAHATFINTIVYGRYYNPDLSIADGFGVTFRHCLLRADGTDDDDFTATLWNADPLYRLTDDATYTYDFHPLDDSPAIAAGDSVGAALCPVDLDGTPRYADAPTIGCYEQR